jgi:tetratricopeptide (TPR) repeat protein
MRSLVFVLVLSCAKSPEAPTTQGAAKIPLFEGLGTHQRAVATKSPQARRYFNQGLNFLYAFNHDEAIRAFTQAAEIDPSCAMAHWGVAIANGPHINNPAVDEVHAKAAWQALERARAAQSSGVERALIDALAKRYADPQPADRKPLDTAYAEAMRAVWKAHPTDADVGALFAEALMDLRPWDLWTADGKPQPETPEIVATLEQVMQVDAKHPLANHLYIHAVEASPNPGKADAAADRLRDLAPALGHLVHMPSHIDVRRGRWSEAAVANEKAIAADAKYREVVPQQGFYRLYMVHNRHMLAWAQIMRGQREKALATMRDAVNGIPPEWIKENAALIDGFIAMPLEVQLRFGQWAEVLAQEEYPEYLPLSRALRHAARGIALAATGKIKDARKEQIAFEQGRSAVKPEATFGNNAASAILDVAQRLLEGEILIQEKRIEVGIAALRDAVKAEDALRYDEPPDWIMPVRHALGAALLKAGRPDEAEVVYREDLARLPENGWSLWGLRRSLELLKKDARDEAARFDKAWKDADTKLSSSCLCLPGV